MTIKEAIQKMDYLGSRCEPFFFIIDYKMQKPLVYSIEELKLNSDIIFNFRGFSNYDDIKSSGKSNKINFSIKKTHPLNIYTQQFYKIQQHLFKGNSYLVNLTAPTEIETNSSLYEIFMQSKAPYKLYYKNKFVMFSPEQFVRIENNQISTFPMKGTIDASEIDAEQKIIDNSKEQEEHATIVDLLRNDLSTVATKVIVEKYRYIDKVKTQNKHLLQVSSSIKGEIKQKYISKYGSILLSLLPAGSICGAPKSKTLEIIDSVENYERGYYTGVTGFYDGKIFDSAVIIRYVEKIDSKLFFKSGGGITHKSKINDEYAELIQKIYVPIT